MNVDKDNLYTDFEMIKLLSVFMKYLILQRFIRYFVHQQLSNRKTYVIFQIQKVKSWCLKLDSDTENINYYLLQCKALTLNCDASAKKFAIFVHCPWKKN